MGIITFVDNTVYNVGPPTHSGWNGMPDKLIKNFSYTLKGRTVIMSGFNAYNHVVNAVMGFNGMSKIISVMIMGRYNNKSLVFIFDFLNNKLSRVVREIGKEVNNRGVEGWRRGGGGKPHAEIK